jgi:hypothetical protein
MWIHLISKYHELIGASSPRPSQAPVSVFVYVS